MLNICLELSFRSSKVKESFFFSVQPADVILETNQDTTAKHQDVSTCPHDTLLFISSSLLPPLVRESSLAAWQSPLPHANQQSAGARAPDRSPSWSQPPNMLSWPALGTAKWFCSCPFVPPSLSKQRTETN